MNTLLLKKCWILVTGKKNMNCAADMLDCIRSWKESGGTRRRRRGTLQTLFKEGSSVRSTTAFPKNRGAF